ncbi:hypothetical protein TorRG33x02_058230 [Trema orientale]|uniref:Uncharacterized protein n=1 Tax=Trema orientale TaxID=63057 RepID=A0A2P5FKC4_TREOI|nr:hypothetical protein TorRG33x02_058230 [Trema orientale]
MDPRLNTKWRRYKFYILRPTLPRGEKGLAAAKIWICRALGQNQTGFGIEAIASEFVTFNNTRLGVSEPSCLGVD